MANITGAVDTLAHVGPNIAGKLKRVGVKTIGDLIFHFPHRYQNFSLLSKISLAQPGEIVTIQGQITLIKNIYTRQGKIIQKASVSDGTDTIDVLWFNQSYLVRSLPSGTWVSLSGKVSLFGRKRSLVSPEFEKLGTGFSVSADSTLHTGRLVPIYPETAGLSSKWLRAKIASLLPTLLPQIKDYLPDNLRRKNKLAKLRDALNKVHFPENVEEAEFARRRLAFDEFFKLQVSALWRKKTWKKRKEAIPLKIHQEKVLEFTNSLPFVLTAGQKQVVREILRDLAKPQSMNRLLEGDVGSGKTVVAALAAYVTWSNGYEQGLKPQGGYKTLFMAPTQILAAQHYKTLTDILEPLGMKVGIVTSGQNFKIKNKRNLPLHGKRSLLSDSKNAKFDVVIGTHALLYRAHLFNDAALVVIDEQHRFGVTQRAILAQKQDKHTPHVLTMTATPIPRTVALTIYGDLDLSVINELPKGRLRIKTWIVPPQKRVAAYKWIRGRVKDTREQAFIVCPLIDISEAETLKTVRAASAEFERLQKEVFPDLRLGLLHGRIKREQKDVVMEKFKKGELDILVSTPVVEVGIDVPNATIMLIEGAERFGLAQLYQLRGRVGRADMQSYCLLFTENRSQKVLSRLKALERDMSGAQLAELDLKLRGPGEIYGIAQSGFPELKIGSYSDFNLIKAARETAAELLKDVRKYPEIMEFIEGKPEVAPN